MACCGGAEAEQHRADRREDDAVGTDVLVPDAAVVQQGHGVEHRLQPGPQLRLSRHVVELGERVLEGRALVEGHHHVGGAVLFPEAVHLDQRRVIEAGEQPRLGDEALQAGLVGVRVAFRGHRHRGRAGGPGRHRDRQVFLDRDPALQDRVPGTVDDREAGFADHVGELVFAQPGAPRQRSSGRRPCTGQTRHVVDRVCRIHLLRLRSLLPESSCRLVRPAQAGLSPCRARLRLSRLRMGPRPSTERGGDELSHANQEGGPPGVAPAEEAEAFHAQHHLAVLIQHFVAALDQADLRPAGQRPRFENGVANRQDVAGIDRRRPGQLLDPGRAEAAESSR